MTAPIIVTALSLATLLACFVSFSLWSPYAFQLRSSRRASLAGLRHTQTRSGELMGLMQTPGCSIIHNLTAAGVDDQLNHHAMAPLCSTDYGKQQLTASLAAGFLPRFSRLSLKTGVIQEAYVSFVSGDRYSRLVTYPIRAVHEFSTRPVVLFVGGVLQQPPNVLWPEELFPRLVVYFMPAGSLNPWFDKLRATLLSPVVHGAIIESETIPTWHSDRLFSLLQSHHGLYPLCPGHPDVRLPSCQGYAGNKTCSNGYSYPAEKRIIDYIHAHIVWTSQARDFLTDVLGSCATKQFNTSVGGLLCTSDEDALNYALWNVGADKELCLFDPFGAYISQWEQQNMTVREYTRRHVAFMYMHGLKEPEQLEDLIRRIKALGKEFNWWY